MSISKNSTNPILDKKRHSMAHLLAASVQQMFPEAQFGVGPVIENGCYYDFILPRTLIPEDLPLIEAKMREMLKMHLSFKVQELSLQEAISLFEKNGQPLKVELLNDLATRGTTSMSEEEKVDFEGGISPNIIYREADFNDINGILEVKKKSLIDAFVGNQYGITREMVEQDFTGKAEKLGEYFKTSTYFVAVFENKIIGVSAAVKDRIIRTVWVDPDFQRKGIGRNLILKVVKSLGESDDIKLDTGMQNNGQAIKFYESLGFERTGKESKIKFFPGQTGEIENIEFVLKKENIPNLIKTEEEEKADFEGSNINPQSSGNFDPLNETPNIKDVDPLKGVRVIYQNQDKFTEIGFTFPANKDLNERAEEMAKNMTKAEQAVWFNVLEGKKTNFKWVKQKIIDNYIVDFYCHTLGLVIEIDGDTHAEKEEYDEIRTKFLNNFGLKVVRFSNDYVYNNLESIKQILSEIINLRQKELTNELPLSRGQNPQDFGGLPTITIYRIVNESTGEILFEDLCKGPHVDHVKELKSLGFALDKFSASYWRGDQERDIRMQRLYALIFETKDELKNFVETREEAKKRDHRVLNETQKYYTISDLVGAGLPLFQPNGMTLRKNIQDYLWQLHSKKGYKQVCTPHIAKEDLYITSGHASKFGDELFRVQGKNDNFFMKPMNCPHHMQIFADNQFSYRDMPIRYFEHATVYRDEKPGQLSGFTRVRAITQDDGHLFCRTNQIEQEVSTIVEIIRSFYDTIGMEASWVSLSVRDPNNLSQYLGSDENWELAEKSLEESAKANNLKYKRIEGEAAFYGPKLDFMFKDAIGREWQLATIQCDFNLPERFDLSFINEDGQKERPVVIHRAVSGSSERFLGVIIDHFAGRFPFWLAPEQIRILTINDQVLSYVEKIKEVLNETVLMKPLKYNEIRFEVDDRSESLGKKIREATKMKIPVMLIVGPKDVEAGEVSVRTQEGESKVKLEELGEFLKGL